MELTPSPARVREARFTSGLHSQVSRRRRKSGLPVSRDDPSRPLRPYTPWYTSSLPGALRAGDSPARARKRGAHGRAAGPGAALGCDVLVSLGFLDRRPPRDWLTGRVEGPPTSAFGFHRIGCNVCRMSVH